MKKILFAGLFLLYSAFIFSQKVVAHVFPTIDSTIDYKIENRWLLKILTTQETIEHRSDTGCSASDTGYIQATQVITVRTDYLAQIPDSLNIPWQDSVELFAQGHPIYTQKIFRIDNPFLSIFNEKEVQCLVQFDNRCAPLKILKTSTKWRWAGTVVFLCIIIMMIRMFLWNMKTIRDKQMGIITVLTVPTVLVIGLSANSAVQLIDWRSYVISTALGLLLIVIFLFKNRKKT